MICSNCGSEDIYGNTCQNCGTDCYDGGILDSIVTFFRYIKDKLIR